VIRVRQVRASAWHGIKTLIALVVLAAVTWVIQRVAIAAWVRRTAKGREVLALFVALTALLVLLVLVGRFHYGALNTVLVLGVVAWLIYWSRVAARRRRARAAAARRG